MSGCELCESAGGEIVWQDALCRVVRVDDPQGLDYPGFCRVIWRAHVKEMSDLNSAERHHLMNLVFAVETALRKLLQPEKMNLASLGNVVPHLHWHVIPRFADDRNFPAPIWAEARRAAAASIRPSIHLQALREAIDTALMKGLAGGGA